MRLRDFRAGPARTTSHSFFSAEFIESHVITTLVCGSAAANSPQLGWCGSLLWEFAVGDTGAARHFGSRNILRFRLRLLEITPKAFPNLGSKCKTRVRIDQDLAKPFIYHLGDKRLQFLD
jgi:hypothetical protein